jgi:tetratricopeptide (TPR) repeat protein
VIGVVQVGMPQAMADRYTYVPLIGLFVMLCWSVPQRALERRASKTAVVATVAVLLGVCAVLCRLQVSYWRDSGTLFRHALEVTSGNWVAHNNLGLFLWQAGNESEAIQHYRDSLRFNPSSPEAHNNLASALFKLGRVPEALNHFEEALCINPNYGEARFNMGLALAQIGRTQEAIAQYQEAVRIRPDDARAHNNMGVALLKLGEFRKALDQYERALEIDPDYASAHNNLAWLLATVEPAAGGDPARAILHAERACALTHHRVAEYHDTLAAAYAADNRFDDALTTAQKAIDLARGAGRSKLAREIEARQQLYRGKRVYRLPQTPGPTPRDP